MFMLNNLEKETNLFAAELILFSDQLTFRRMHQELMNIFM